MGFFDLLPMYELAADLYYKIWATSDSEQHTIQPLRLWVYRGIAVMVIYLIYSPLGPRKCHVHQIWLNYTTSKKKDKLHWNCSGKLLSERGVTSSVVSVCRLCIPCLPPSPFGLVA